MKTLRFDNGDEMPILGLGTWKSKPGDAYEAVREALGAGYRHIDCALIYGNEAEIGRALAESMDAGGVQREALWITSKLWNNAHAPKQVRPALEKTLRDLGLDYLDLYLIHWPVHVRKDILFPKSGKDLVPYDELPVADTWRAMEKLVEKGLCRHIGVSNFSIPKLRALATEARVKPEMNQVELHPYLQQPEMLDFCRENDIHLTAYSPLGSADRPPVLKTAGEPVLMDDPTIAAIAERHGVSPAQVLIGWAVSRGTAVIPKSVHPDRIAQNLAAADLSLTRQDLEEIEKLDRQRRYVNGEIWAMEGSPYTVAGLWDA